MGHAANCIHLNPCIFSLIIIIILSYYSYYYVFSLFSLPSREIYVLSEFECPIGLATDEKRCTSQILSLVEHSTFEI